ncbi:MAG: beta-ketoacyl synthase chain length factor [Lewinellaceae bacterium]|nr:beta-ketoacyl synthase chain length factor [Lewinellaceae bacterium]
MYITAASTISHQPTFRNKGFAARLAALERPSELLHPDYKSFIPAMNRRRMSDVLAMAMACSVDCLEQCGVAQPDAILVGTSMGSNFFTKTFLDKIANASGPMISPTAFILSTHNTIAGQISLFLGNSNYNMTHTQNSLSFEQALLDGMLCLQNGSRHVLVGAADESEDVLYNLNARLKTMDAHATCGASFFVLSAEKPDASPPVRLVDVGSFGLIGDDLSPYVREFLQANQLTPDQIDLVLYAGTNPATERALRRMFDGPVLLDYQVFSGVYYTNPAFALHYAVDLLTGERPPPVGNILICNNLIPENLGLLLIDTENARHGTLD